MGYYVVTLRSIFGTAFSNPFINVFQYLTTELAPTTPGAAALADQFYDNLVNAAAGIKSLVVAAMEFDLIEVRAPQVPTVLALRPISVVGTATGTQTPRFTAWGFKSERTRADIRAGFKRFGLISESDTAGDVPTASALTKLNAVAALLSAQMSDDFGSGTVDWTPIIVKRIKYTAPSGRPAYRFPEGTDTFEYSLAQNWSFDQITTQNSRKA